MVLREERALSNCQTAIDMHEIYERVSIRGHQSFLPHGAIFKTTRDILTVGDAWAVDTSPLELQNAETKCVASSSGSRHLKMSSSGMARRPLRGSTEGPAKLVATRGCSTSQALSTLQTLLAAQKLRRGEGPVTMAASQRNERLFGENGRGRSKDLASGIKVEKLGDDYMAKEDTCIRAFVRLIAQCAVWCPAEAAVSE